MRVLHLIDPAGAGWPALDALSLLLRDAGGAPETLHSALLIGGSADERLGARLGVRTLDRLHPPLRRPELARAPLERFLRARGRPDVVHAWSVGALRLGAAALPRTPRVATLGAWPPARPGDRRRGLPATAAALFPGEGARRAWARWGVAGRVAPWPIDASRLDGARREDVRAGWGIEPGVAAIGLLGEPEGAMDARAFAFLLGLLAASGRQVAGVVAPGAHALERALRFIEHQARPWPLIVEPELAERPWAVVAGLDCGVWLPLARRAGAGAASCAWAVCAGRPVAGADLPALRELREEAGEGGAGAVRPASHPIDLAARVFDALSATGAPAGEAAGAVLARHDPAEWRRSVDEAHRAAAAQTARD